ncbi:MAG: TRAP transporter substrate-binding protein DctP, partial [Alphaproteobacteria bacterium]|nr:TRAP transporter substrate-binding protein DctP [Alphaproteobacteria bacterium]
DGGGLELHNRLFQEVLDRDVVVFPISPVGNQPLGWFNREVKSWEDLATIKCRATGITGEVMSKSGMKTVNMSGGEILPAVERGIIDCAEWAGPAADIDMGFYQILKHYYLPSAHEPATLIELIINGDVWRSLPKDIQEIMKSVSWEATLWQVIQTHRLNAVAIKKLKEAGVKFHKTPDSILDGQMKAWEEIRDKAIAENPFFAEVIESQRVYAAEIVPARQFSQVDYDWLADYYWKK